MLESRESVSSVMPPEEDHMSDQSSHYAPAAPRMDGQTLVPAPTPKKKRGCMLALAALGVVALCLIAAVAAAYFGLIPLGKPRDLGVRYTEKDYNSGIAKLGMDRFETGYGQPVEGTEMRYSGSKAIDVELTQEEVSALLSLRHSPRYPVSDLQVLLKDGNGAEASGIVTYAGVKYPVYVNATAQLTGPKSVSAQASSIDVSGVQLPAKYWPQAQSAAVGLINERLARMDGLNIESASVEAGKLHIKGTIPAVAERVPVGQ